MRIIWSALFQWWVAKRTLGWHSAENEHFLFGIRMKSAVIQIFRSPQFIQSHARFRDDAMTIIFDDFLRWNFDRWGSERERRSMTVPSSSCWLLAKRFNGFVVRKKCFATNSKCNDVCWKRLASYLDPNRCFDRSVDHRFWFSYR